MSTRAQIVTTALIAAIVSAAVTVALRPAPAPAVPAGGGDEWILAEVDRRLDELRRIAGGERIATVDATGAGREAVLSRAAVEAIVREVLGGLDAPRAGEAVAAPDTADAAVARLLEAGLDSDAAGAIWRELRAAGRVEEVVAALERRAAENPGSPDARVDLGEAYVQLMFATPDGPERAAIGAKIDAAFSAALELDPGHWRARFKKAVGLSYTPAAAGRHSEAIQHFEVLLQQQASRPSQPNFAKTYLYLGNLYEQRGDVERARATWQAGLAAHPGDGELRDRLGR